MQASRPPRDSGHASTSARQHAVSYRGSRRHLHRLPRRSEIDISALVDAPELAEDLQAFQGKLGAEFDVRALPARFRQSCFTLRVHMDMFAHCFGSTPVSPASSCRLPDS